MPRSSACRRAKKRKSAPVIDDRRREQLGVGDPQQRLLIGRALADQRQELLRQRVARHRPEPRAGAAGEQNGNDLGHAAGTIPKTIGDSQTVAAGARIASGTERSDRLDSMIDRILTVGGIHAAVARDRLRCATSCWRRCSAPGRWPMRSSSRCGCRTISARSSPRARSTPPSCRPMRASASTSGADAGAAVRRPHLHAAAGEPDRAARRWRSLFTPAVIGLLAPGFNKDPGRFALAVELTRITFPYLLLISLVTLYGGILNALDRFATPAAAPILLNLSMMMALALAAFFPTAGHAAAWGVLIAGVLEVLLVGGDAVAAGRAAEASLAAVRRRGEDLPQALRAGDRRLGRNADRAVRRHHHRELPRGRRAVGALLRRPAQPASDRRDRHRRRHRAAAGDGAADRGRRRDRRARMRRTARSS